MDSKILTLSADGVTIHGKYYTVSNGFVTKANGMCHLRYRDLLSVELVKRRSKKAMYAVLLSACVLMSVLMAVRANIGTSARGALKIASAQNVQEAYNAVKELQETLQYEGYGTYAAKAAKVVLTVLIVLVAIVGITGALYLFSGRRMVELTTMRGTYRVAVKRGNHEIKNLIAQLQSRL
jgi:cytochrome c-type biogenesis protein CcmH/NrfG